MPSAVARLAVFSDHHVPDLTGNAVAAGVQLAVNDNAAANAGAERYHQHVARALGRTGSRFAERGAVRVVIQMHRTAELRQKRIRKADVIQTQIGAEPQGAGFLVKRAGHADADRRYVLYRTAVYPAQRERQRFHICFQAGCVAGPGRKAVFAQQRAVLGAERRLDGRAAQINTDSHSKSSSSNRCRPRPLK